MSYYLVLRILPNHFDVICASQHISLSIYHIVCVDNIRLFFHNELFSNKIGHKQTLVIATKKLRCG
jgi:hypothetical protein